MSPDLGTPGYGVPLNETWYRRTVSHNTVVIDGVSQPPNSGTLNRFDASGEGGFWVADASASWETGLYSGVRMRRVILWDSEGPDTDPNSRYFLDLFPVARDRTRQLDWVFRCRGQRGPEMANRQNVEC